MDSEQTIAAWVDEKVINVRYFVVRLHDLDEARLTRIETDIASIKRMLERTEHGR